MRLTSALSGFILLLLLSILVSVPQVSAQNPLSVDASVRVEGQNLSVSVSVEHENLTLQAVVLSFWYENSTSPDAMLTWNATTGLWAASRRDIMLSWEQVEAEAGRHAWSILLDFSWARLGSWTCRAQALAGNLTADTAVGFSYLGWWASLDLARLNEELAREGKPHVHEVANTTVRELVFEQHTHTPRDQPREEHGRTGTQGQEQEVPPLLALKS